jgi:Calcineurin-like phosphoesterase
LSEGGEEPLRKVGPWELYWRELLRAERGGKWEKFSWLTLRALISSVNDLIGKGSPSLVRDLRSRWVAWQRAAPSYGWNDDLVISMRDESSFIVLGDPGEQDASQYAVVPALLSQQKGVGFMVICSDVIYPSGDVNDYVAGFYRPYEGFKRPIFAIPGNHDWYDGLNGFMWHLCGAEALPGDDYIATSYSVRERLARFLWRRGSKPDRDRLVPWRNTRAEPGEPWRPHQPGPYWAIETADLMVVGIDTGITGEIDREQGEWLKRVSAHDKPKILLTGKPLLVNRSHEPCDICDKPGAPSLGKFPTVDSIVRHPAFNYVATIGGDIHNYQHYPVTLRDGRRLDYVVSGGGGAYMSATHPISPEGEIRRAKGHEDAMDGVGVGECDYYPTRVDSLKFYAERFVGPLWRLVRHVLAASAGFLAAFAVVWIGLGTDTRYVLLLAAALVLLLWLLLLGGGLFKATRNRVPPRRHQLALVADVLAGLALGLTGWWLEHDHFLRLSSVAVGLTAFGAAVAYALRRVGPDAWKRPLVQVGVVLGQAVVVLLAVIWAVPDSAHSTIWAILLVFGLFIAVPVANVRAQTGLNWVARRLLGSPGWDAGVVSPVITVLLLVGAAFAVRAVVDTRDDVRGVTTAIATIALVLLVPLLLDLIRRLAPRAYRPVVFMAVLSLGGLLVWLAVDNRPMGWVARALATSVTILGATVLASLVSHLTFLGAFSLVRDEGARTGMLTDQEAKQGLDWRDGHNRDDKPPDKRVERIVNFVYPGATRPGGPLQRKISEIFDTDDTPFHKNFLRLDVEGGVLTISCIGVSGEENSAAELERPVPIRIPLPPAAGRA